MRQKVLAAIDEALLEEIKRRFSVISFDIAGLGLANSVHRYKNAMESLQAFHALALKEAMAVFSADD